MFHVHHNATLPKMRCLCCLWCFKGLAGFFSSTVVPKGYRPFKTSLGCCVPVIPEGAKVPKQAPGSH